MDEEGTVKQRRVVDSKDVSDYASHIEPDQVSSRSEDEIEYKKGVLQRTSGTTKFSILSEVCFYMHFNINILLTSILRILYTKRMTRLTMVMWSQIPWKQTLTPTDEREQHQKTNHMIPLRK